MKYVILFIVLGCACSPKQKVEEVVENRISIEGTWQLLSAQTIVGGDTTFKNYTVGMKGIKMLNENYFAFFQHDLNKGADSTARYVSGGGTYTFENGHYVEYLEYCTAREWEDNTFEFEMTLSGDTLIQEGRETVVDLGIDRIIRENYIRIN